MMTSSMTLQCDSIDTLMECIAQAVMRGITFESDAATLTITFTGGY